MAVLGLLLLAVGLLSGAANISMFFGYPKQKGAIPKNIALIFWFIPILLPKFSDPYLQKRANIQAVLFVLASPAGALLLAMHGNLA